MTNRILCHKREMLLKLNFFQLMERYHSWGSVLISIYQLDSLDLKKLKCACDKAIKKKKKKRKTLAFEYEFSLKEQHISIICTKVPKDKFPRNESLSQENILHRLQTNSDFLTLIVLDTESHRFPVSSKWPHHCQGLS